LKLQQNIIVKVVFIRACIKNKFGKTFNSIVHAQNEKVKDENEKL